MSNNASSKSTTSTLKGAAELKAALAALPQITEDKVMRRGLAVGAARLRTYMRMAATRVSGTLRKSIGIKRIGKNKQNPKYVVGLLTNAYYKVLDAGRKGFTRNGNPVAGTTRFDSKGTQIENTYESRKAEIADIVVDEATKAFAKEAGKLYVKSGGNRI